MAKAAAKKSAKAPVKSAPKGKAAKAVASKGKAVNKKTAKSDKTLGKEFSKGKNTPIIAATSEVVNPRAAISTFYVARINEIESKTHLVSNVAKYMDPLSSGYLTLDWLFSGGYYNGFASVSGPEGAGKSMAVNHAIASAIRAQLLFNFHMDAEGTINDELAAAMFAMSGIDYAGLDLLKHKPYRYYKDNVIETIFDFVHSVLRTLPQKVWVPTHNSWAYVFDKRDANEAKKMEIYGVKAEKSLSRHDKYVCLTDYSGLEAAFFPDSFAAMVSIGDDEEDQKSRRRAVEASAFSDNLKRISSRLSSRGCLILGVNQLRKTPNVIGRQDPWYEPGGEALKFYSAQRARFNSVSSGFHGNDAVYNKEFGRIAEPSVIIPGSYDLYDYKSVKNTKNKMGNPNKKSMVRVWVADHAGQGHGFDPAYDLFNYLIETGQLLKDRRKLKFNLRKSVGSKRADMLNSLPEFTEANLKALTLSEVFNLRELTDRALKGMNLTKKVGLREALFNQVHSDKKILAIKTSTKKKDDEDYEDDKDSATEY